MNKFDITPEQKRRNELTSIHAILRDNPNNEYWLNRLEELLGIKPGNHRVANRECASASNQQLREWYQDLLMRKHIRDTFTVFVEASRHPVDIDTVLLEIGRRINEGIWD